MCMHQHISACNIFLAPIVGFDSWLAIGLYVKPKYSLSWWSNKSVKGTSSVTPDIYSGIPSEPSWDQGLLWYTTITSASSQASWGVDMELSICDEALLKKTFVLLGVCLMLPGYCELSKEEHHHLPMGPESQLMLEYRYHSYGWHCKVDQSSICCHFHGIGSGNYDLIDTADAGRVHSPQWSLTSSVFLTTSVKKAQKTPQQKRECIGWAHSCGRGSGKINVSMLEYFVAIRLYSNFPVNV